MDASEGNNVMSEGDVEVYGEAGRGGKRPELLAPAGNWECARAAVTAGADAIFFGLPTLNARLRADNFGFEDLEGVMSYLHERGVKGLVTMNTLVFTEELGKAEKMLVTLYESGVDAIIVQDVGLAVLAREVVPDLAVHASTQMTITSPEGVAFAKRLGVRRAVLARELSLRELKKFQKAGEEDERMRLPLETFVHGALCVAYSGQCLTSEALGQRSANRGECAQACRLPYEMVVDGVVKDLGDRRYLLSPQDLAAVHEIPELMGLGVDCFKIEGRLKNADYVAAVTEVYRKAIDAVLGGEGGVISKDDEYALEMAFSRGLYSGWMHGVNHQKLVHGRFGKKRGPFVGYIRGVGKDWVEVEGECEVRAGDGVVFDTGGDTNREQGGRVFEVQEGSDEGVIRLFFSRGKIRFQKIHGGDRVWKTDDPQFRKRVQKVLKQEKAVLRRRVLISVSGRCGEMMRVLGKDEVSGNVVELFSEVKLEAARTRPLTSLVLERHLGRLGETGFELAGVVNELEGEVMLPLSQLNEMRRRLVEKLEAESSDESRRDGNSGSDRNLGQLLRSVREVKNGEKPVVSHEGKGGVEEVRLSVLCRTMEQLDGVLDCGVKRVYVDFEDVRRYRDAVECVRRWNGECGNEKSGDVDVELFLATPRIQKAGEEGFFKLIQGMGADGVLVRNLGALSYFRNAGVRMLGDFSLNVANPLAAKLFYDEGVEKLTVSYDLNAEQVEALVGGCPEGWFELVLHQHLPMFHMEHCVFAAFLSEGTDHTNCGRPCEKHRVRLRDRVGVEHPVHVDVGCRNTVYHYQAQSGAVFWRSFFQRGVRDFRVELLGESGDMVRSVVSGYQKLLRGAVSGSDLVSHLGAAEQLGVTSGTLTVLGGR